LDSAPSDADLVLEFERCWAIVTTFEYDGDWDEVGLYWAALSRATEIAVQKAALKSEDDIWLCHASYGLLEKARFVSDTSYHDTIDFCLEAERISEIAFLKPYPDSYIRGIWLEAKRVRADVERRHGSVSAHQQLLKETVSKFDQFVQIQPEFAQEVSIETHPLWQIVEMQYGLGNHIKFREYAHLFMAQRIEHALRTPVARDKLLLDVAKAALKLAEAEFEYSHYSAAVEAAAKARKFVGLIQLESEFGWQASVDHSAISIVYVRGLVAQGSIEAARIASDEAIAHANEYAILSTPQGHILGSEFGERLLEETANAIATIFGLYKRWDLGVSILERAIELTRAWSDENISIEIKEVCLNNTIKRLEGFIAWQGRQ
jgi:hypothetical protein